MTDADGPAKVASYIQLAGSIPPDTVQVWAGIKVISPPLVPISKRHSPRSTRARPMYPKVEGVSAAVRLFCGVTVAVAKPLAQVPAAISTAAAVPRSDEPDTDDDKKFKTSFV